jgi:hypothetical protein
MEGELG